MTSRRLLSTFLICVICVTCGSRSPAEPRPNVLFIAIADLDGQSLLPLLVNPDKTTNRTVTTLFNPGNISLRDDRFRYIRYKDGSEELYDLQQDPNEWNNLVPILRSPKGEERAPDPRHAERLATFAKELPSYLPTP